jgi:hypothetical protein
MKMPEWFDPQTAGRIGGTIGTVIGLMGAFVGVTCGHCIRKGWKIFVYTSFILPIIAGVILLITGIVALVGKQPYHVWYCFLLPGLIMVVVFSGIFPVALRGFREREIKQMQAKDL